jgi:uncharacterized protein YjhX (UPF0386 family)
MNNTFIFIIPNQNSNNSMLSYMQLQDNQRYFYQLHKEGKLEAEYERVIGSAYFEALRKDGFIIPDVTIPNFFKRLKPDI